MKGGVDMGFEEKQTLKTMLETYRIAFSSTHDPRHFESSVACSIIKDFLAYCYLKGMINEEDYSYIRKQDIISTVAGHKAFYDILERKFTK